MTEPCYLRTQRSAAFATFFERVYGKNLNQYGTADMEQIQLLIDALRLKPGEEVLDAGCGTGETTEYLAAVTGARFTGIDTAERAIANAQERTRGNALVVFRRGDMNALDPELGTFDAVVAIESLYFAKDLAATFTQMKSLLRPGGRMGLFYTQVLRPDDPVEMLAAGETKVARALKAAGLTFETHDLSESDRRFWTRSEAAVTELGAQFEAEGISDLSNGRAGEGKALLDLAEQGRARRYLYCVRGPATS